MVKLHNFYIFPSWSWPNLPTSPNWSSAGTQFHTVQSERIPGPWRTNVWPSTGLMVSMNGVTISFNLLSRKTTFWIFSRSEVTTSIISVNFNFKNMKCPEKYEILEWTDADKEDCRGIICTWVFSVVSKINMIWYRNSGKRCSARQVI